MEMSKVSAMADYVIEIPGQDFRMFLANSSIYSFTIISLTTLRFTEVRM